MDEGESSAQERTRRCPVCTVLNGDWHTAYSLTTESGVMNRYVTVPKLPSSKEHKSGTVVYHSWTQALLAFQCWHVAVQWFGEVARTKIVNFTQLFQGLFILINRSFVKFRYYRIANPNDYLPSQITSACCHENEFRRSCRS